MTDAFCCASLSRPRSSASTSSASRLVPILALLPSFVWTYSGLNAFGRDWPGKAGGIDVDDGHATSRDHPALAAGIAR
jgi:hypothetical protein